MVRFIIAITGLCIMAYASWGFVMPIYYSFTGTTTQGVVTGFKAKRGHAKLDTNPRHRARAPYFEFTDLEGNKVESYGTIRPLWNVWNYDIGDKITLVYPSQSPQSVRIKGFSEKPTWVLMFLFGMISVWAAKDFKRQ